MSKFSVMIVDDHPLFREGLKLILGEINNVGEIFQASNGEEFLRFLSHTLPDMVLMDIEMPLMNGIEATRIAVERFPTIKIIALSMYSDDAYYFKMIESGAKGFIAKNSDIDIVEKAMVTVMSGNEYFSAEIMSKLIKNIHNIQKEPHKDLLTERESEILYLICKGLSNQEIADSLFLSKRTVDKHRENILSKTESKNTAGLVLFAIKNKIIDV
jgi:DNA-binding NarL/FixJ family response regulator